MNRFILIDGNSLLFRAFFALPPMTSRDGIPTGAVHGFLSMLLKLLREVPDYCAVAFDLKTPTIVVAVFVGKQMQSDLLSSMRTLFLPPA